MKICAEAQRKKDDAGEALVQYFALAMGEVDMVQATEIRGIVDMIFDAAVAQARAEREAAVTT